MTHMLCQQFCYSPPALLWLICCVRDDDSSVVTLTMINTQTTFHLLLHTYGIRTQSYTLDPIQYNVSSRCSRNSEMSIGQGTNAIVQNITLIIESIWTCVRVHVYSSLCHRNLQSRNSIPILFAHRWAVCVSYRPFVPKELDMNLTSLKVGIHRHCSINKLN